MMILQDLTAGQPVTLELVWGTQIHKMKSSVIGTNEKGVLIQPFIYNGVVIDLPAHKLKDITFNIYTLDPKTSVRKAWKSVNVVPVDYKGRTYYACSVNKFQKDATDSERRDHPRTEINVEAQLVGDLVGQMVPIRVKDISDNGLAFFVADSYQPESTNFTIILKDTAHGSPFELKIMCRSVRSSHVGEENFYGCSITQADKNLLMYVFMKRMEQHAEQNPNYN